MTRIDALTVAIDLLEAFVDDERCSYDHHGTCQTHFTVGEVDSMCGNSVARNLLDEMRPGWSE